MPTSWVTDEVTELADRKGGRVIRYRLWVWQHEHVKAPLCDLSKRRGRRWRCTECRYNERAEGRP